MIFLCIIIKKKISLNLFNFIFLNETDNNSINRWLISISKAICNILNISTSMYIKNLLQIYWSIIDERMQVNSTTVRINM